jgi:branched-chain amino acid transport system ATP-binding protein
MALLEIRDVASGYGEVQILWGVAFRLEPGQLTTLVGSNGAGKTTLLRTIMGLVRPWQGQITFRGRDITRLSPHEKAADGLILVPEGRQLFTEMTVRENLEMGAVSKRAQPHKARNLAQVFTLFPRLKERLQQRAGTLSIDVLTAVPAGQLRAGPPTRSRVPTPRASPTARRSMRVPSSPSISSATRSVSSR